MGKVAHGSTRSGNFAKSLIKETPGTEEFVPGFKDLRVLTTTRGSNWRGRSRVEKRLREKGKMPKDFYEGTIQSSDTGQEKTSRGSLSLDVDLASELDFDSVD
ncbi:hypothetical protein Scep_019584 [Stephania cephalantha]|uniref:Uncharacterized protein n=1 Tax=Stephania cephalantha TaxID=152367 RepID=A0AAP0IBG3_9MAGN